MKKFISVVAAFAMGVVMATSAFAAQSDVDALKNLVNGAKGFSASDKAQAVAFIDDYAMEHADKITAKTVSELQAIYNEAINSKKENRTNDFVTGLAARAQKTLADAGITLTINSFVIENGRITVSGSVSAQDAKTVGFNYVKEGALSKVMVSNSTAAANSPIKRTGVDASSVIVLAVGIMATLGGAAIGVRKMGLQAQ